MTRPRRRPALLAVLPTLPLAAAIAATLGCSTTRDQSATTSGGDATPRIREMTLYNAPPTIEVFDYGFPGGSAGDVIVWHAPLASSRPTGPDPVVEIGICTGTMIVVRSGGEPLPGEAGDREHRMTHVELDWHGSDDSVVIMGSHPYQQNAPHSDRAILRAVIGGTGRFIGARGEVTSTPIGGGWYEHRIRLVE